MYRRSIPSLLVASATFFVPVLGCGESHPPVDSSLTEATVKGVVKIQGKAAQGGGQISFNPSNVERKVATSTAKIEDDGSYSLSTFTGGNVVKFSGPFIKEHPEIALASRYRDIGPGENVVNFNLLAAEDNQNEEPVTSSVPRGGMPGGGRRK
jgi:hypothetical protein